MAISVVCAKCQARFNVSDKFAGQTGPCPKCKQPIKIPKATGDVTIHGPSKPAESSQSGQMPTAPIVFKEESVLSYLCHDTSCCRRARIAWSIRFRQSIQGRIWPTGSIPFLLQALTAFFVAIPCAKVGYTVMRDKELEPYRGRPLAIRVLVCSMVYAALWYVRGTIGIENPEIWQWTFLAPVFLVMPAA